MLTLGGWLLSGLRVALDVFAFGFLVVVFALGVAFLNGFVCFADVFFATGFRAVAFFATGFLVEATLVAVFFAMILSLLAMFLLAVTMSAIVHSNNR
jgi:hypothetical protein